MYQEMRYEMFGQRSRAACVHAGEWGGGGGGVRLPERCLFVCHLIDGAS